MAIRRRKLRRRKLTMKSIFLRRDAPIGGTLLRALKGTIRDENAPRIRVI